MAVRPPLSLMPVQLPLSALLVSLAQILRLRRHHRQVGVGAAGVVPREGRVETRRHRRRGHRQRRRQRRRRRRDVQGRRRQRSGSLWGRGRCGGRGERRDFLVRLGSRRRHRCGSTGRPFFSCNYWGSRRTFFLRMRGSRFVRRDPIAIISLSRPARAGTNVRRS